MAKGRDVWPSEDEAVGSGTCQSPVSIGANVAAFSFFFFLKTKKSKEEEKDED